MAIIECKECGKEVSDQAQTCPHCGFKNKDSLIDKAKKQAQQINEKAKINESIEKTTSAIKPQLTKSKEKIKTKIIDAFKSMKSDYQEGGFKKLIKNKYFIGLCVVFFIIAISNSGNENSNMQNKSKETIQQDTQEKQTANTDMSSEKAKSPTTEKKLDNNTLMLDSVNFLEKKRSSTDLQYKEFIKSLKNKKLKGTGAILETKQSFLGYNAFIQAIDGGGLVTIKCEVSKDIALSFNRGQEVTFIGKFDDVDIKQSEEITGFNRTGGVNRTIKTDIVISLDDTKIEG